MVQINELRIDNYLTSLNGYMVQVAVISKENIKVAIKEDNSIVEASLNYLNPLLLTTDILHRCGFVELGTGANPQTKEVETIFEREGLYISVKEEAPGLKIGAVYLPVPSLHRLQNLFFELTGKDLVIQF